MKSGVNMIIGKRQIILAALVLGLGVAVYLNWEYSNMENDLVAANRAQGGEGQNYGEAQFVASPQALDGSSAVLSQDINEPDMGEAFFVEAKLSRQMARDEAVETLAFMLADASLNNDQRTTLTMRAADLAQSIEAEGKIETLIRAKGFPDVMVYYDTQRADIMVKTAGLVAEDVMKIKDIVLNETSIEVENISIIEIN
ncbi:MAG: SpoIIIAH-like family protein [Oscillospiraceae bacterium]|nr:SpoIIIAH-like family protein [Oscillospiraceae bacterium]